MLPGSPAHATAAGIPHREWRRKNPGTAAAPSRHSRVPCGGSFPHDREDDLPFTPKEFITTMISNDSTGTGPAPIVVTHRDGLRFSAQIRSHELIVDQSEKGGGRDAGPSPIELLGASLGSCVALYVHKFLLTRGLPTESLRVEVVQHSAQNPNRIASFEVRVHLDDIAAVYRPMLEAVARVCPAHNTLAHGAEVRVAIDVLAPAGSAR